MTSLNLDRVKEFVNKSTTGKEIMEVLAKRQRSRGYTVINRFVGSMIHDGLHVDRTAVSEVFWTLQEAGIGKMVDKNTFVWNTSIPQMAKAILGQGETPEIRALPKEQVKLVENKQKQTIEPKQNPSIPKSETPTSTNTLVFDLPKGKLVVKYPVGVSLSEIIDQLQEVKDYV